MWEQKLHFLRNSLILLHKIIGSNKRHALVVYTCVCEFRSSSSSSKQLRRERSRKSKRDRVVSPVKLSNSQTSRLSRGTETVCQTVQDCSSPVRKAMSPSVAQCLRAVYAAFLWHKGIVDDAMTCSSFLKFHPSLPKDLPKDLTERWRQTREKKLSQMAVDTYVMYMLYTCV